MNKVHCMVSNDLPLTERKGQYILLRRHDYG